MDLTINDTIVSSFIMTHSFLPERVGRRKKGVRWGGGEENNEGENGGEKREEV